VDLEIKDIPEELKKLEDNRALILLVELMGFLHDVGKLSENRKEHHRRYEDDVKSGIVPNSIKIVFEEEFGNLLNDRIAQYIIEKVKECKIKGFQRHHTGDNYKGYWPENWIEEIINLSDNKDSSEDRGKAANQQDDYIASVFGKEEELEKERFDKEREKFYHELQRSGGKLHRLERQPLSLGEWEEFHTKIKETIRKYFSNTLAETRRAANDITLFDHSYMTGSISKALVGKAITRNNIERFALQIIRRKAEEDFEHFEAECDLEWLIVSFDGLGFISQGTNLLDLRGRTCLIESIREEIKSLLEVKYPLGNCIYEDENNLCFLTVPINGESFDYIKEQIWKIFNEETKGLLIPVIKKSPELRYYGEVLIKLKKEAEKESQQNFIGDTSNFKPKWIEEWRTKNKDKCVLCGKIPQWKGADSENLCKFCWELRYKVKEKGEKEEKEDSSWIDEIADENGKIAFVVGSFHPLDKWLSGEFLNCQYIRTLEDIDGASLSFLDAAIKFVEKIYDEMNNKGDFVTFLRIPIYKLNNLSEEEKRILGGGSKVGEIYYRLSEDSQTLLKEKTQLSEEEINKIAQEVVDVTTKKPSSPSRLYRIWRELEDFSEEAISYSRGKMLKGKRLKFELKNFKREVGIYEAEIQGIGRIEVFHGGDGKFSTIERIDKNNPSDEIQENYLKNHEQIIEKAKRKKKISIFKDKRKINEFEVEFEREGEYKQFREVLSSPNGFIFILPAKRAFEVIRGIKEKFEIQFSKVLGKISLNIGIVYSHRKRPIYISLDAVRRFRDEFKFDEEEGYIAVEKQHLCKILKNANKEHLYQYLVAPIKVKGKEIFWKVHHTLGDGNIDWYYPYFTSSNKLLHITDVTFNDKLSIYLNYLDFEYLDTTTRRFDIVLSEDKKRTHPIVGNKGPRPYLLEDVDKFERLKEIFERIGSWTPIRDIEALAASKRQEWSEKGELGDRKAIYEELIDSALENKLRRFFDDKNWGNNVKPFLLSCIMEGSFFDAIELFKSIMKMELKGGRG